MVILAVFIGGGMGSVCRYLLGTLVQARTSTEFPVGTLVVNVLGCLAVGMLGRMFVHGQPELARAALIVGFCGGFTTFSAFSLEAMYLLTDGKPLAALGYVATSVVLCFAAAALGFSLPLPSVKP